MENLEYYETDSLIEMIVAIGHPLPVYNYEKKKYQNDIIENINTSSGVTSIISVLYHDTFKDACKSLLTNNGTQIL